MALMQNNNNNKALAMVSSSTLPSVKPSQRQELSFTLYSVALHRKHRTQQHCLEPHSVPDK